MLANLWHWLYTFCCWCLEKFRALSCDNSGCCTSVCSSQVFIAIFHNLLFIQLFSLHSRQVAGAREQSDMKMDTNTRQNESLFSVKCESKQPLRKYEPLIRVDIDGQPLPRRLLRERPECSEEVARPTQNELKRSLPVPVEPKNEPKKKHSKGFQPSIKSFFNKS